MEMFVHKGMDGIFCKTCEWSQKPAQKSRLLEVKPDQYLTTPRGKKRSAVTEKCCTGPSFGKSFSELPTSHLGRPPGLQAGEVVVPAGQVLARSRPPPPLGLAFVVPRASWWERGAGCRRGAQPGPGRGCRRPGGSQAALPPVADAGVPSSADSRLRLRPGRGERVPKMAASWAWRQAGLPRRRGRESKAAPAAPHLPCCVAQRVPSAAQSGPGLAAGTPALHPFGLGYSGFALRFAYGGWVERVQSDGQPALAVFVKSKYRPF